MPRSGNTPNRPLALIIFCPYPQVYAGAGGRRGNRPLTLTVFCPYPQVPCTGAGGTAGHGPSPLPTTGQKPGGCRCSLQDVRDAPSAESEYDISRRCGIIACVSEIALIRPSPYDWALKTNYLSCVSEESCCAETKCVHTVKIPYPSMVIV